MTHASTHTHRHREKEREGDRERSGMVFFLEGGRLSILGM